MIEFFPPIQALKDFVKQIVVLHSVKNFDQVVFLPNGGNFIIFNRGVYGCSKAFDSHECFDIPQGNSVSVKLNKVKQILIDKDQSSQSIFPIVLVELEPIGYYMIFNKDASQLNDGYLTLDQDVSDNYFNNLYSHNTIKDEVDYLNTMLHKLYESQPTNRLCIKDMIHKIVNEDNFETPISELLDLCNCSRSTLERYFKKVVGLTPKKFIFIMKFGKTLTDYVENGYSFNDLPYIYSDQSHMYAVFKKFLGLTPREIAHDVNNNNIIIYQLKNFYENDGFISHE